MIRAIIFDFDGVILESASIKTEAFGQVVTGYPKEQAEAFVAYHLANMGISRHVKFRHFIEEILHEPYSEEKEKLLADTFEHIVHDRIKVCPFVPGAKDFLERNHGNYDLFIASGTPDGEMNRIVDERGLRKYFKGVYGTPRKKPEIIRLILDTSGYDRSEAVFVGDAGTDLKAAGETGLAFVGRNTEENREAFRGVPYTVDDIMQLEKLLGEMRKK